MRSARRFASTLSQFIVADLKRRRDDWPLVAYLLSEDLRRAADGHTFKDMLAGNQRVAERFAQHQKERDADRH